MFGLSANESFILGVGALWVYSAAVAALPEPTDKSSTFYSWAYKFLKAISGDLSAKFGQYIPKVAAVLIFALMFALPVQAQTTTTTSTTTSTASTGISLSASTDAVVIHYNKSWDAASIVGAKFSLFDFGKTKTNHLYVGTNELLASGSGFNIYTGMVGIQPDLSTLLKKTNLTVDNISVEFDGSIGSGVLTTGAAHISWFAGGNFKYRLSSTVTWNAVQAGAGGFGGQKFEYVTTGFQKYF